MSSSSSRSRKPFWRKPLSEMSRPEWESLCDRCGRCCLVKLEDEDTGRIHFTSIGCRLLQTHDCSCSNYRMRQKLVPDCVKLTPETLPEIRWLPPTCAYRLVQEGKDLMWWHPLVSGSPDTVHEAGVSVRGRVAVREDEAPISNYGEFIVSWPGRRPRARTKK
ncbi:MAG TPA: YcgN family cysteine cluster protein [Beijerinckiaceae bacterium]|nr:YcgN family cysteine cluster protein [Beijerinckiaceae bacterium]